MKERAFIDAVHRHLPKEVHRQSMTLGSQSYGGTPDYYYDLQADLWVEYKAFDRDDHFYSTIPDKFLPTALQRAWLDRRFAAGGNAVVVVGLKLNGRAHGFFLETPQEWSTKLPAEIYKPRVMPVVKIAERLLSKISMHGKPAA